MCGFVSVLFDDAERPADGDAVRKATQALHHRGPDDDGFYTDGPLSMGFRRLSILDLSPAGHQPMKSDCGRYVIVFNGEIYNFIELRAELESSGDIFVSRSDTEVILAAYRKWGTDCFRRFNGMWGLCIWDTIEKRLTVCRDRFGIKPLYIAHRLDRWILGSELAALRHVDPLPRLPCLVHAADYLHYGFADFDDGTTIEGWNRVPAGHFATISAGDRTATMHRYYNVADACDFERKRAISADKSGAMLDALADELRAAIIDSVRLRLRSDVPVGTCLSGGLDSASIVCATASVAEEARTSNSRHAFSAMMPEFDESAYINAVVRHTGVRLTRADVSDEVVAETCDKMLTHQDEPVHSLTALAGSLVFKAAVEHGVTVLLNGQGADELLAGYGGFVPFYVRSLLSERGPVEALRQWRAEGIRRDDALSLVRFLAGKPGRLVSQFIRGRSIRRPDGILAPAVAAGVVGRTWLDRYETATELQTMLDETLTRYPLPLFLRVEDRNAMSWSREARLPYLDPAVVRICRTAPASVQRRGGLNKFLQRKALKGLIPEIVRVRRDKMGFPAPHGRWMRGPLRDLVLDTLSEERLSRRGIYNVPWVLQKRDEMLSAHTTGAEPRLLRAFLYEAWARRHIDR